jgi:hypothetical protein
MEPKKLYRDILYEQKDSKNKINSKIEIKPDAKSELESEFKNDVKQDNTNSNSEVKQELEGYQVIDVRNIKFKSVYHKDCPFHVAKLIDLRKYYEEPLVIIQDEDYTQPLTFESMKIGNYYYIIKEENGDDYYGKRENIVFQCAGKGTHSNGVQWITYKMFSNPDFDCIYEVYKSKKYLPWKFRRLPKDFWTNYKKYENQISKEYYMDHVADSGIY